MTKVEKGMIAATFWMAATFLTLFVWTAIYESRNPCTEYQETGRTVCSSYCTGEDDDILRHCWQTCEPETECVSRQMADGTVWEK